MAQDKYLKDEKELLSKPGDTILETLEYLNMTQAELGKRMGKTPSKINDLISGKEPITVATALQLEMVLDIDAQFWLNRETLYREKLIRIEQEELLEQCKEWLHTQPIRELQKFGYLKTEKSGPAMVEECLKFYGVASPRQWEAMYAEQFAATDFRRSAAHATELASMTAWLRIGEIEMRNVKVGAFDKDQFKKALELVRELVQDHPEDFASRLQELCRQAGVVLIYTMTIPKAPISGAVRWIGGTPLIQMTDRFKTNDHFWFTFFHESSHILLHGKKEVFIENFSGAILNKDKEHEADMLANKMLIGANLDEVFKGSPTEIEIRRVARRLGTHPAIILGRLQHLEKVAYSFGNNLKIKVSLTEYIQK